MIQTNQIAVSSSVDLPDRSNVLKACEVQLSYLQSWLPFDRKPKIISTDSKERLSTQRNPFNSKDLVKEYIVEADSSLVW